MASPQTENGFTRLANEILDRVVNTPLLGSEFQVVLCVLRKTYGYQKKVDIISLSQFQKATGLSRPTVVKTIKNLMTRKMIVKVYLPDNKISFSFNKNYDEWVVKEHLLVKDKWVTSKGVFTKTSKGALTHKRKKETNTKETLAEINSADVVSVIDSFEDTNPSFKKWYGNTTQRSAIKRLIETHGLERLLKAIKLLPSIKGKQYFPSITTPVQLEDKWASLEGAFMRIKNKEQNYVI